MKKRLYLEIICWLIGATIWAIIAWTTFSEGRQTWGWIQIILSIGFALNGLVKYYKFKKR